MGKHEAPGRTARKATIVTRTTVVKAGHGLVHFVAVCVHTTAAVIVVEKTSLLSMIGLLH